MKYDAPQKCLEIDDGPCSLVGEAHVCTQEAGHSTPHSCDCGKTWTDPFALGVRKLCAF